ncbi:MAG: hypothetical protein HQ518_31735 [Rhodopirellula sp.]|nr:hypothetical protein [Rhodopirellula sp.]
MKSEIRSVILVACLMAGFVAFSQCHKAADKPYLRPRIPEHPATTIITLDPHAAWPQ